MRIIEIRNIKNTPEDALPLGYSSWLDYWETKKGRKAYTCSVINCRNSPDVGGHVRDADFGYSEYILPMCRSCHNKSDAESFGAWNNDLLILDVPIFADEEENGAAFTKGSGIKADDKEIKEGNGDLLFDEETSDEETGEDITANIEGIGDDKMVNDANKEKNDNSAAFADRKDEEKEYSGSSSRTADLIKASIGGVSLDQSRIDQIITAYRAKMGQADMTKTDIAEGGLVARQANEEKSVASGDDIVYTSSKNEETMKEVDGQVADWEDPAFVEGREEASSSEAVRPAEVGSGKALSAEPIGGINVFNETVSAEQVFASSAAKLTATEDITVEGSMATDVAVPIDNEIHLTHGKAFSEAQAFAGNLQDPIAESGQAAPRIYLASPHMGDKELAYVKDAFESNWIAPLGPHVDSFEKELAEYVGSRKAVALNSGTAAIHLALKAVGVEEGDMVFCSTFTFAGSCNPILYMNAIPVFIDSEPNSLNMSPLALEKAFQKYKPKAVIVVNLYGQSADYDKLVEICNRYNTPIIEDAAESLGATYKGKMSGTFGKLGIFSFNGNKIITTSGGGMVVSDDEEMIEKIRFWATQARDPAKHYQHSEVGYNYRLSNICAAIGRGQMTVLEDRIAQKKRIYHIYKEAFAGEKYIMMMPICDYGDPNYWLSVMMIKEGCNVTPLEIIEALENENIESRPVWKPMHLQPLYAKYDFFHHLIEGFSVAGNIYQKGLCLPSDTKMGRSDLERIIDIVKKVMN